MKKIYALILHEIGFCCSIIVLDYYSSKKKAVCALQKYAELYGVACYEDEDTPFTSFCYFDGKEFFYYIREYNLL